MIAAVKAKIDKNPRQNICKMARDMNRDKMAVLRAGEADLSMKSRAVMKVQGLTAKQRKNRKEKCKVLLNKLKKGNSKIHVFGDEKIFTVDAICMSRTNRYIAKKPKDVSPATRYMGRTKHPASAMMLDVAGLDGKAFSQYWIQGNLDTVQYKHLLTHKVFPALNATYGQGNWVWTQDGVPCHTSRCTQAYLQKKLESNGFWSKSIWPANLPNLNPIGLLRVGRH